MQNILREYAHLLISMGVNLQKGQTLNIRSTVECAEFVRLCVDEAYKAGAKDVLVDWRDDKITRMKYLNADESVFKEFPHWETERFNFMADNKIPVLHVYSEDPGILEGVDSQRITDYAVSRGNALKKYYSVQLSNGFQWSIGAMPIPSWAKKVFPNASEAEAMKLLLDAILKTVYVTGDGKSEERWREHIQKTAERASVLNELNFKALHYKSSLGTDFTVELPEGHLWMGGAEKTTTGIPFVANMPTEEIFTSPKKASGNGIICASKPLCIDGNIINDIKFTVENGKIIKAESSSATEVLKKAISVDEGACYFGELALVPYNSPISNMNILFYNTLFDENASCHIAFGEAYPTNKNADKLTAEELEKLGYNKSITHEDFMIGTKDLSIIGITHDGREIEIFRDGNFAI